MQTSPSDSRAVLKASFAAAGRRLLLAGLVLLSVIYLSYFGLGMAAGTELGPALSRAAESTLIYLGRLLQGDLGLSSAGSITLLQVPVSEVLPDLVSRSFGLLGVSLLIAALVGVMLGIFSAARRRSRLSLLVLICSIVGISLPSFFLALLLQMGAIQLNRFSGTTILSVGGFGWDRRILLPALVLAARPLAQIARVTFISISETLDQDYVRTARSKGVREFQILAGHVFRNTAIPILTTIGLSLRFSLSSLPVVEYFYGWPGIGYTLLKAIARQDHDLTIALLLSLGAFFIGINLLLEAAYPVIDPRLRVSARQADQAADLSLAENAKASLLRLHRSLRRFSPGVWWQSRRGNPSQNPFKALLDKRGDLDEFDAVNPRIGERRAWLAGTLGNLPFMVGAALLLVLFLGIVYAPQLSRHSPFTTKGMVFKDGRFSIPPFAPGEEHLWGTDVLGRDLHSLILAGAQQTLLLATLVMAARLGVGFVLGAAAGWFIDRWIDRLLRTLVEVIAAFPTLLISMTLILALGIRRGMAPFVISLCLVGWGEIMQYVRAEVIKLRPRLFVESALALGVSPFRIVLRHILPNLIPTLAAISALEMGAVLMLLGELGFIGIFIGGGSYAELDVAGPAYHFSDVPEWGALLSNIRLYARSYPWTALYPSLAFFIAILGFNLFGEGLRRFMDVVGVHLSRVINRYTFSAAAVIVVVFVGFRGSTGALPYYQKQALVFEGARAFLTLSDLASPEMEGRAIGSSGYANSAEYIAEQFKALGLQPAGEKMTYFQTRPREFTTLTSPPILRIDDAAAQPEYPQDFVEFARFRSQGSARAGVRFFAIGEVTTAGSWGQYFLGLKDLDYREDILLVVEEDDLTIAQMLPRRGILYVSSSKESFGALETISTRTIPWGVWGSFTREVNLSPTLVISEETANRILAPTSTTVRDLRRQAERLTRDEVLQVPVHVMVSMEMEALAVQEAQALHVIGHLPGAAAAGGSKMDDQLVVVLAQYDSPPARPGRLFYPAANDNASGMAVMLEIIRTMQESGYQPNRTFLFVAFSGEGMEGGERVVPRISKLLQTKLGFDSSFKIEAVIDLRGLGSSDPGGLYIYTGGSQRLPGLFERAADQFRVPVHRAWEMVDLSIIFDDRGRGQEAPYVRLSWDGWEDTSRQPTDTIDIISPANLEKAGRVISLALMLLGREINY
jgi:ABC-type dipeptide/oligopeptide/nickel transport system permease component